MQRCIQLAQLGEGNVAPNPLVGAVLVYEDKIIGEGYHAKYGEAHAEVNCIKSVSKDNVDFISKSILYVSLEPCAHFGKTPPCVNLIIENKIPHVVIGSRDSFVKVNGSGISTLQAAGIKVEVGKLKMDCRKLNKRFFTYHEKRRPYIILKWAQTNDGFIAHEKGEPIQISNEYSNKWVHKWRSEEAAILVGTNTVLHDNPTLTTRNWQGKNPKRIVIDASLKLNLHSKVFGTDAQTIIINRHRNEQNGNLIYYKVDEKLGIVEGVLNCLYENQLNSVIIEGGSKTLQYFIEAGCWDEARVITNTVQLTKKGINAPILTNELLINSENIFKDRIDIYKQKDNEFL